MSLYLGLRRSWRGGQPHAVHAEKSKHLGTKAGLKMNAFKSELFVFTRKHKVPTFTPPSLAGKKLEAKGSAKYLGVNLVTTFTFSK